MTEHTTYCIDSHFRINTEGRGREIPTWFVVILAPLLGLAFLMFLPVIGFWEVFRALGIKIIQLSSRLLEPAPVPGTAHLTGTEEPGDPLEELAEEVEDRRSK